MVKYKDTIFSVDEQGNCYGSNGTPIGTPSAKGYMRVGQYIGRENGVSKKKYYKVHRMVAETFIPNPNNLPQVNHINGIKTDNRVENLEWCNGSHNMVHAFNTGLHGGIGEKHYMAKVSDDEVRYMREQYATGKYTIYQIAKVFNMNYHSCYNILKGKTRKYI